jgi:WD40 repeat protein
MNRFYQRTKMVIIAAKLINIIIMVCLVACGVSTPLPVNTPTKTTIPTPIVAASTPAIDPSIITPKNVDHLVQINQLGMGSLVDAPLYSPDGQWIFLPTTVGVFMLDTNTYSYDKRRLLLSISGYSKAMSISPDGKILAVGNQLVSLDDGHELSSPKIPPHTKTSALRAVRFSPDDTLLTVIYYGGQLDVWRMSDGQLLYTTEADSVDFSSDSRLMVITVNSDEKRRIKLYEAQTGKLLRDWAGQRAVFLPNDQLAVETYGAIRIFDLTTGKAPYAFNGKFPTFSPDGQFIAFLSTSHIEIRRIADGKLLYKLDKDLGEVDDITLHFAPDGETISIYTYRGACCGGGSSTSSLWNVADGTLIKDGRGARFTFSSDGRTVALPADMGLHILNTSDGSVQADVEGLVKIGRLLAFQPDTGDLIEFDGYFEHTLLMYDLNTDKSKWVQLSDLSSTGFSLDQAGKFSALSSYIYGYWKEDQKLNALKPVVQEQTHHDMHGIMFSPDGQILAVGTGYSGVLNLWDIQEQRLILQQSTCPEKMVNSLAFSPDGSQIAVACRDHIWEDQGEPDIHVWHVLPMPQDPMVLLGYGYTLVTYSPDGRFIAGAGNDVQVWNAVDGSSVFSVERESFFESVDAQSVAFTPSGEILAFGLKDGSVELWSVQDGKQLRVIPGGGYNPVLALAFSPDGKYLAMGFDNGSVQLWSIK